MEYKSFYDSPVGRIVMVSDGNALSYLGFDEQRFENPVLPSLVEKEDMPAVFLARKWLDIYFSGRESTDVATPSRLICISQPLVPV